MLARSLATVFGAAVVALFVTTVAVPQSVQAIGGGLVRGQAKISNAAPGFPDDLDRDDRLGSALVLLGDLDGDGIGELAIGASGDDDGEHGALYVLFRNADGSVRAKQKISAFSGDFQGTPLGAAALAPLGDLDQDGVPDLAVGAFTKLWILFLNADGTVKREQEIADGQGGFQGPLAFLDFFGHALANLGDLDGDGVVDLAVGEEGDDDGGIDRGAVWILFLRADGTVRDQQKISALSGGFQGFLEDRAGFGSATAHLGDLDGDGSQELAVGAQGWSESRGAVWILSLLADGTVLAEQELSETAGGFQGLLLEGGRFGAAATSPGDLDADGVRDLVVGASAESTSAEKGSLWVLFLNATGTVKDELEIGAGAGGFQGVLLPGSTFGDALGSPGDLDGDGALDLLVGEPREEDSSTTRGAYWTLLLNADGSVKDEQRVDSSASFFRNTLDHEDGFGSAVAALGDLDGDGVQELAIGASKSAAVLLQPADTEGEVWILHLDPDGAPEAVQEIGEASGGFPGDLDPFDRFGAAVAALGDWNADGVPDLAVGAPGDDDGGVDRGALWILFLDTDGAVLAAQKISASAGGFGGALADADLFGSSVAVLGDLDGDGLRSLAVGASGDDDQGSLWILDLSAAGTVQAWQRIGEGAGGFQGLLNPHVGFGSSVARVADLDGDGVPELAVGAPRDGLGTFGNTRQGAAWILFLTAQGSVKAQQKIAEGTGGLQSTLVPNDAFATGLASPGDLDVDGVAELVVGIPGYDAPQPGQGAVWLLFLNANGTVAGERRLDSPPGGFQGTLDDNVAFGASVGALGDLDADGVPDLVVGASRDGDGGELHGAAWILLLESQRFARPKKHVPIPLEPR